MGALFYRGFAILIPNIMRNVNFVAIDFETATQKDACQLGIVIVEQGEIVDESRSPYRPYSR